MSAMNAASNARHCAQRLVVRQGSTISAGSISTNTTARPATRTSLSLKAYTSSTVRAPARRDAVRPRNRQQARHSYARRASLIVHEEGSRPIYHSQSIPSPSSHAFSTSTCVASTSQAPSQSTNAVEGPRALYSQRVEQGLLREDPLQMAIVDSDLERLYHEIISYKPPPVPDPLHDVKDEPSSGGFLSRLFGKSSEDGPPVPTMPDNVPRSLYLFGDVGCGKSMLMDLLYEALPESVGKRRVHFHAFMIDVHKKLHHFASEAGPSGITQKGDAIVPVARELAKEGRVLCFDEFQVTDIADAMILRRLLESMIGYGFVIITTSNRAPKDLYKNGIQRKSFLPCIDLIYKRFEIRDLDSETDYRKIPRALSKVYYHPNTPENLLEFAKLFEGFSGDQPIEHDTHLKVWGRDLRVPKSSKGRPETPGNEKANGSIAMFTFEELCGHPLSAADYLEIVKHYDTVFISNIPSLGLSEKDKARRFITFIDAAYDSKTKLLTLSHDPITQIFSDKPTAKSIDEGYSAHQRAMMDDLGLDAATIGASSIFTGDEEIFAFARAVSRLSEMGTRQWAERVRGA